MQFVDRLFKAIAACAAVLAFACFAFGQDLDDVTVSGRVVDTNGQAVAGVTVLVTETVTGAERTITTNEEGRYRVIELKPGVYTIRVSAAVSVCRSGPG